MTHSHSFRLPLSNGIKHGNIGGGSSDGGDGGSSNARNCVRLAYSLGPTYNHIDRCVCECEYAIAAIAIAIRQPESECVRMWMYVGYCI